MFNVPSQFAGSLPFGMFSSQEVPFGLATLQADPNCVLIQDPSAVWGIQDFLPRRNLLLATDTLATQNVTVVATAYKLYMQGTGSITLSGTGSGTLNGTGANDRVSLSFTPTAGTCTFTVSGTVTYGMLCRADTIDQSYQKITDWTTEQYAWAAQKQVPWLRRNRFLNTATLSTQTVSSVTATPITVSFKGTGTITFSTAYVGSLVGTGATDRVTATFTPAAGNLVCTVSGTVTEAQCEVAGAATEYQPIGASWDAQYTANAIAAGYPISLWHDAAGTIAAWESGRAIGAVMDQKYGDYGPNLVSNGTFDSDTTGWSANEEGVVLSVESGKLKVVTGSIANRGAVQDISVTTGKTYYFNALMRTASASISVRIIKNPSTAFAAQTADTTSTTEIFGAGYFTAEAGNTYQIYCRIAQSSATAYFDNISIREIPGYTAIQSTAANQPLWVLDANGKPYFFRDLTNDALPITLPNLGSNCVIYVAEGNVTLKDSGITLNGSYAPIVPAADYGRIIMAADSRYDAKIVKYLDQKRGRAYSLGPELVTNGNFSSDTAWVKYGTATITGGVANVISSAGENQGVAQNILTVGKTYLVTVTVNLVSGQGKIQAGSGASGQGLFLFSASGTYQVAVRANGSDGYLFLSRNAVCNFTLDNVSVSEVTIP